MKKILMSKLIAATVLLNISQIASAVEIPKPEAFELLPALVHVFPEQAEEAEDKEIDPDIEVESNLIAKQHYWGGEVGLIETYVYNESDQLIQKIETEGNTQLITEYNYNKNGDLVQKVSSNGEIIDYLYNKWGNMVQEIRHHDIYETTTTYTYEYDDYNNLTKKAFFNTRDQIDADTYVYNDRGLLSAEYIEGNKYPRCKYFYDENDNLIKIEYYVVEKKLATKELSYETTYTYDELGRLIQDDFYTYEYDDYGNIAKQVSIFGAESFYTDYVYEHVELEKSEKIDAIIDSIEIPTTLGDAENNTTIPVVTGTAIVDGAAESTTAIVDGAAESATAITTAMDWKQEYINFISTHAPIPSMFQTDFYKLVHIDDDEIPELYIDGQYVSDIQYILASGGRYLALSTYGLEDVYYIPNSGNLVVDQWLSVEEYKLTKDGFELVEEINSYGFEDKSIILDFGVVTYGFEDMRQAMTKDSVLMGVEEELKSYQEIIEEIENY